jgi:hypothetical protein
MPIPGASGAFRRITYGFLVDEEFLARIKTAEKSKRGLIELSQRDGHFVEAGVHFAEDGVGLVFSVG